MPWADAAFDLIVHAELHYIAGEDFDRRIAMISFDNAIEVAITTYLSLHPTQRGGAAYPNADVERWCVNYHSKLDFFFLESTNRGITCISKKEIIVWCHSLRNDQYHSGGAAIPRARELKDIREASLEIFSVLYGVQDAEQLLRLRIDELSGIHQIEKTKKRDTLLDDEYGIVEFGESQYYASELIYNTDPIYYRARSNELEAKKRNSQTSSEVED